MSDVFMSTAILVAREGHESELRDALLALIDPTRAEPGCREYVLLENLDRPGTYWMRESFDDAAAFDAHGRSQHFLRFAERSPSLLAEPLQLVRLATVSAEPT